MTASYAGASVSTSPPCTSSTSLSNIASLSNSLPLTTESNISSINRTRSHSASSHSSLQSEYSSSSDDAISCSTDDEDFNSTNTNSAQDACISLESSEQLDDIEKPLTSKEIAVLLIELRYRHSLTRSCIDHICELLQLLKVPNAPLNFHNIETLVLCAYRSTTFPTKSVICPSCYKRSSSLKMCTSTIDCDSQSSFVRAPTINFTFALEPQIRSVIERNQITERKSNKRPISDITDGLVYAKIVKTESQPFITLLMNSDGGLVKASSTSIWLTTFIINELPRRLRFLPENMIIGMISSGGMKPKKQEMSVLLIDIVNELRRLEEGISVCLNHVNGNNVEQVVKIFLLACVNDKPATSLLLNHKESTGFFGCSYCTIKGNFLMYSRRCNFSLRY